LHEFHHTDQSISTCVAVKLRHNLWSRSVGVSAVPEKDPPWWTQLGRGLMIGIQLASARHLRPLLPALDGGVKWLSLSLRAYVGVAFTAHVDGATALKRTFWQAAHEVEKIKYVPSDRPLRIAPEQARAPLKRCKRSRWRRWWCRCRDG